MVDKGVVGERTIPNQAVVADIKSLLVLRGCNLFWGNHLHYFCIKLRLIDKSVLFHLFHAKNNAKHYRHYFDCSLCDSCMR